MTDQIFDSDLPSAAERHLIACLHITLEDWDAYAEGYKLAGNIIVQYIADNDRYQDFVVYPIVFLYRQYLELRLKELIIVSSRLLRQEANIPKDSEGHNLLSLWKIVRPNIEEVWPPDSQMKVHLDTVEERIKEFCYTDPNSEEFRYPRKKKGALTLSRLREINLRQLKDVIQGISHVLDGSSLGMGEYLNAKHEIIAEYQNEMRSQWGEYNTEP